jgi:hypothetical protein
VECPFFLSSPNITYASAKANCENRGAKLVSLSTKREYDAFVSCFLPFLNTQFTTTEKFWIGLNEINAEGNFVWEDGTSVASQGYTPPWSN